MPNPRKTVEELKRSGTWQTMTKAEQQARLAAEAPLTFEFGAPPKPKGLSPRDDAMWRYFCEALLQKRVLARTDGPLLEKILLAKNLGDAALLAECVAELEKRQPFPEESAEPPAAQEPERVIPDAEEAAKKYAADVVSGAIVACKLVKQACQRFLDDLKRSDIRFDPIAAQHVVNYISRLCLDLLPWQIFILANLFGWKLASGLRRFRYGYILVAKKNGKTALSAALCLYMADPQGDGEPYANAYCAATTKYQSQSLCFKAAVQLRERNSHIADATRMWKSKASITWPNSLFEPLAANSEKLNGLNIHFGVLDELGDHPTSDLHNVFTSSTTGRKQPLIVSITTAGESREQIAYEIRNRALQVLDGTLPGDSFFAYVAELDAGDKPEDESVWIKANPSLGVLVPVENIRDLAQQAAAIPSTKHAFLRYSFNIWPSISITGWVDANDLAAQGCAYLTDADKALSPMQRIKAAEERLKPSGWRGDLSKLTNEELRKLAQNDDKKKCFAGLDLGLVNDLSALCLLFPPSSPDGVWESLFRIWCPEENIITRSKEQRVPYEAWRDSAFIIATPGSVTDNSFIKAEILKLRKDYQILELGFDRALAVDLVRSLEIEGGMKVTQVAQGFSLSPAIKRIEQLIVAHKFCMFGQPVVNWNFSNVALAHGFKGDSRLERNKSREKIDAAAACCNAMFVALAQSDPVTPTHDKAAGADRFKVRTF